MSYEGSVCADNGQKVRRPPLLPWRRPVSWLGARGDACCSQVLIPDAAAEGLVAYYTFDDNAALDSSGNGHHAAVVPMAGPGYGPSGSGCAASA